MTNFLEQLKNPRKEYSPVTFWWWSGDKVNKDRLRWQLEKFVEGGLYNLIIINLAPTGPIYGAGTDSPMFHTDEWWELFESVCKDAKELGAYIWFYDQIGFSGTNLQAELVRANPKFTGQSLESIVVEGDGQIEVECPPNGEPLSAAAIPIDDQGNAVGAPVNIDIINRKAVCNLPGCNRLRLIYSIQRSFDYLYSEACKELLETVHGEVEKRLGHWLGDVIAGTFQDELPSMPTWSINFVEQFIARKGYDPTQKLIYLWEDNGPEAKQMRIDYQNVRSELAEEAFFKPFYHWHEKHGMICGFDQQSPSREGEPAATVTQYADYLKTHRWYGAPGSDHHGEAKIHSSIAHINDRPRVWIESFHTSGWGATIEETSDWLMPWLRAGANLFNPHAAYYSTYGGWWEWAPPSYCWRQPYWGQYPTFSDAISRLCYLLTRGHHVCDVGILYPTTTVQANITQEGIMEEAVNASKIYRELTGQMLWNDMKPGILDNDRRDFDILSDEAISEARVIGNGLTIKNETYKAVILPGCTIVPEETAKKLCEFVENGGLLIAVGDIPKPLFDNESWNKKLLNIFEEGRAVHISKADDVPEALKAIPREIDAPVPVLHRRYEDYDILYIPGAFPEATEQYSTRPRMPVYSFDPKRYSQSTRIFIKGNVSDLQLWDVTSGKSRPIQGEAWEDGYEAVVPLENGPASILIWKRSRQAADNKTNISEISMQPSETIVMQLDKEWSSSLIQTMDNRYGDFDKPDYPGAPPVSTWFFDHRVERQADEGINKRWFECKESNGWEQVQATFGVFAKWIGPMKDADLPSTADLASGRLDSPEIEWKSYIYSLSRGIPKDPIHIDTFGPKGHVPEEFFCFDNVKAGEGVHIRTGIWSDSDKSVTFALGGRAIKTLWLNGKRLDTDKPGYLIFTPANLKSGLNILDIRLVSEDDLPLRGYWSIINDVERFKRPEWIAVPDYVEKDHIVRFSGTIDIPFDPTHAVVQIAADSPCSLIVNDVIIGRQGGFDPYNVSGKIQPYEVDNFKQGKNIVTVEVYVHASSLGVLADGLIYDENNNALSFASGEGWMVKVDDEPQRPAELRRTWRGIPMSQDPCFSHLWQRPHPLPDAEWLSEKPADDTVAKTIPDASLGNKTVEWFRWVLPPGAVTMNCPVSGEAALWVDGKKIPIESGKAILPNPDTPKRYAYLRVIPDAGLNHGAVFTGPVTYEIVDGKIELGDWCHQGLDSYSGGVGYQQFITLDELPDSKIILDLGTVRGTCDVFINGIKAGTCIWSPYKVEITGMLKIGKNEIRINAFNTLAPYLNAVSPTSFVFPGQTVSGIFGPVTIRRENI